MPFTQSKPCLGSGVLYAISVNTKLLGQQDMHYPTPEQQINLSLQNI